MTVKVIDGFRLIVAKKGQLNIGTIEADADNDTLTLEAGSGISFTVDANNDRLTIINTVESEVLAAARAPIYVRADDSTIREVRGGESFGIVGSGAVTTASNAEGDITVNASTDLSTYDNTSSGFITGNNLGDRADVTITSITDNDLLQYDTASGQWQNQSITNAGFATVSTTGSYNDLTNRPNITFSGDATGSTGGVLGGGASTVTLVLDSVATPGTYNGITIDAKGRVTNINVADFEQDTLQTVTARGATSNKSITVAGLTIGNIVMPNTLGADGTVLKVNNGVLQFGTDTNGSFNIVADDSTVRKITLGETIGVLGTGPVTTSSDAEGNITINSNPTIDQVLGNGNTTTKSVQVGQVLIGTQYSLPTTKGANGTVLGMNNGQLQFVAGGSGQTLKVRADDSTEQSVNPGEALAFLGGGNVTTSSNAEGEITITSSPTLTDVLTNGSSTTTAVDFQGNVTIGSDTTDIITVNGALAGRFPLSFEGLTDNSIFTRFEITDPTGSQNTVTFPDASGTVAFVGADISTFNNDANYATTLGNVATATALQTARNFEITGVVTAGAQSFDGSGNVTLTTQFANQNISQFVNDAGFVTSGLTTDTPISTLPNDAGYMTKWFIGADDSSMKQVSGDEAIKIMGSGAVSTASDVEGNITVTASNNLSSYNNDAGFNTENDTITLTGDLSGSGKTTINATLSTNLSSVSPGTYNYVTVDTKGIVQSAEMKNYIEEGALISQDLKGSVYADDSTLLIDGVAGTINAGALTGALPAIDGSALTGISGGSGATSINTAGNTGTGSVTFASETLTVLGTTGQINVDAAAFALSFSLDSDITGLSTINTHTIPGGTGTIALTSDITGISNVVEDTSPQLGGDLDVNGNNILFGDNEKAKFGDGPDLEIYHDGTDSYIDDVGVGSIFIRSGTTYIQNAAGTKTSIATNAGAGQTIYYNNSPKLETTTSGIKVSGVITIEDGVQEKFASLTSATGVVAHDCSTGHIFRHSSISANFTANFTNLTLEEGYATTLTLSLDQGGTAYMPTAVQIGGVAQTIVWQGNSAPSGTANGEDVVSFSILRTGASAYTVLGQRVAFGGV